MAAIFCVLVLASLATAKIASNVSRPSLAADIILGQPLEGFVSFSIEFSSFPDFAGNGSNPNKFSNNLLNNLGYLIGTKPYIRVGGNTQDYAIYNPNLTIALNGTVNATRSPDYPTTIEIGPLYFESYLTWPNVKFTHGFNMGGNHDSRQWDTLLQTAAIACKTLGKDRLNWWEYGNEPDLFSVSSQGPVRPSNYSESDYVAEWLAGTRAIKGVITETCPDMLGNETYGYLAPSFAGVANALDAASTWAEGLDSDGTVRYFSTHNYISGATSPGVTLQGTLMNHTRTRASVDAHVSEFAEISAVAGPGLRQIMGETNSLYNQGKPGLSNSFGAALWGIDFNLYCASVGIGRVHMHMGTNYRYASWQPITTNLAVVGTKAPYYGNIAVAAFLGNLRIEPVRVAHLDLAASEPNATDADIGVRDSAYAAYVDNVLTRIMVINMRAYNYTLNGTGDLDMPSPAPRKTRTYTFGVEGFQDGREVVVRRLFANGSDAITGITWDGLSYNYELDMGKPVRLRNVTTGEKVEVKGGAVEVAVPDSQAVVLDFDAV
ncbi:glycoside hydrolase family 79 protein [Xylaria bambusicola]|uniref:glycoside hydrolase family 79 protein n=1 Tax=Xylaria bambusicola TaxID=326684 RepID=UPI002007F77E|nr:glycoside hydrolase family 79 protein [Xylaria bambusicola]KAI0521541.1 glycoside hydrolase family 79 protein [Xylaria bambusicola]